MTLADSVLAGERLALSRLLTQVENGTAAGREALTQLFPHTGRAHLVGVTGAPGTGKSSLVNQLAHYYRRPASGEEPRRVAVIAVDPSSPFSGGAILGDRIRMRDLAGDPGVFIRSMASRGSLGGLAAATAGLAQVFDAAGFEIVMIETVGAGQAEVDIARLAHTTLVVEAPGLGDEIQAIKAGILEIADLLVINKADRPGVENTERALRSMLELAHPTPHIFKNHGRNIASFQAAPSSNQPVWMPSIIRTVSTEGTGIPQVAEKINQHKVHLEKSGEWARRDRARLHSELENLVRVVLMQRWRAEISDQEYEQVLDDLLHRRVSPYELVEQLTQNTSGSP